MPLSLESEEYYRLKIFAFEQVHERPAEPFSMSQFTTLLHKNEPL